MVTLVLLNDPLGFYVENGLKGHKTRGRKAT